MLPITVRTLLSLNRHQGKVALLSLLVISWGVLPCCRAGEQAPAAKASVPPSKPSKDSTTAGHQPVCSDTLDLTYAPTDALGVVLIRPAAIFRLPGMKEQVGLFNQKIAQDAFDLHSAADLPFSVDTIAQILFVVEVKRGKVLCLPTVIRFTTPVDWQKCWPKRLIRVAYEGSAYYQFPGGPHNGPCAFLPDPCTLIFHREAVIRSLIKNGPPTPLDFADAPGWKQLQHSHVACLLTNRQGQWDCLKKLGVEVEPFLPYVRDLKQILISLDMANGMHLDAYGEFKTERLAEQAAGLAETALKQYREDIDSAPLSTDGRDRAYIALEKMLIDDARIQRKGSVVSAQASTSVCIVTNLITAFGIRPTQR